MSILSRETLADGSLRERLSLNGQPAWTEAQVAQSLADTLAGRPEPDAPVWVFAYGSLIWNPLIRFEAAHNAVLPGWRRSFCLRTVVGRGRPEQPGRMLSLQPGGQTQGVALRLAEDQAAQELRLLWAREMTMGSYRPAWVRLALQGGGSAQAITFVAAPDHPNHEPDDSVATVAALIAVATGAFGRNVDYLLALQQALRERGLQDPYVDEVVMRLPAG